MLSREQRKDIYERKIEAFKSPILEYYEKEGVKDTGDFGEGLSAEITFGAADKIVISGIDYSQYVERGRGPGARPPIAKIKAWVRRKLALSDEKQVTARAYAIARKISNEGSRAHRDKTHMGMISERIDAFLDQGVYEITDELKLYEIEAIREELFTYVKKETRSLQ